MSARSALAALSLVLTAAALGAPPLALVGCSKKAVAESKTYSTKGTVKSFGPDKKFVNIAHENIPGYMAAMTMSFEPKTPAQLEGLAAGDKVAFTFSDEDGHRVIVTIAKAP